MQEYEQALQNICKELEKSSNTSEADDTCHLTFVNSQGEQLDKYFKDVETDSVMVFAQAAVEDAISEFGDSLEKEQRVKILLDLLQQELE